MSDPQAREGPQLPDSPYEGMDWYLTADYTWPTDSHAYTPGHYVYISTGSPLWQPFGGATDVPPGTPT